MCKEFKEKQEEADETLRHESIDECTRAMRSVFVISAILVPLVAVVVNLWEIFVLKRWHDELLKSLRQEDEVRASGGQRHLYTPAR